MPTMLQPGALSPTWRVDLGEFVSTVAWSPDGTAAAAGSLSGAALLLSTRDGQVVQKLTDHPLGVLALSFSPASGRLAVGGQDGLLRIYDLATGLDTAHTCGAWVQALAWAPDGATVAAGAGRDLVVVADDGTERASWSDVPSTITSVAWATNGQRVAAGCYGGPRWYEPGAPGATAKVFDWKGSILTLAVAPNGKWLAAGNQDNSVHIWRLWSADDLQMSGYPAKVEAIAWDPTSRFLAVGSVGDVTIWDFSGRGPRGSTPVVLDGFSRRVTVVRYQHRGRRLAAGSADGLIVVWEPARHTLPIQVVGTDDEVSALEWSPDDTRLLFGTASGDVGVIDVPG
ncbi:MAG: WD40 repeat domain-containing protein [Actinobacteria bacterium]|nr:WD40 repeat domain-containing protein [Actinomycetota bacterium]